MYTKKELIEIIQAFCRHNGRIPLHAEFSKNPEYPNPDTYYVSFGSWNEAIREAGFIPNEGSIGSTAVAKDGHKCRSLAERIIDDWLFEHSIAHEKEVYYPSSRLRADWYVRGVYVEYLGLALDYGHWLNEGYRRTLLRKRALCQKHDLILIELYPADLGRLARRLSCLVQE